MKDFVRQCLHRVDSRAGELVGQPYGESFHGSVPNHVAKVFLPMLAIMVRLVLMAPQKTLNFVIF